MKTYQDWLEVANRSETERMEFIRLAITEHKASHAYKEAITGEDYYSGNNTTIQQVQKVVFNALGNAVPDYLSANHKIASRFFYREVTQTVQVLLGNGITWKDGTADERLGRDFDKKIAQIARGARVEGTCFGFWNMDHVEVYDLREFVPLYDEENGALMAGFRFWQIDDNKPLRVTAFEIDGYTDYIWNESQGEILHDKRAYILNTLTSEADGTEIYEGVNYPKFPVVPCFSNSNKESELNPLRATIDAYDLINSGYANDVDDANLLYWTITNAGGMDDVDLIQFFDKLRKNHMAQLDGDQDIQAHSVDLPYQSREAFLERIENQLYKDAMALNTYDIASGAVTATQIEAAYDPLNQKLDLFEGFITDFIQRLLEVIGIVDEPTYTRSIIVNKAEDINSIINSALYLDDEYVTEKIMTIMGDKDKVQDTLDKLAISNRERMTGGEDTETETV